MKFLGFIINTTSIYIDPAKVEAIYSWEPPEILWGVRAFLGLANFYWRFVKEYRRIIKPLIDLIKNDRPFDISEGSLARKAFD